MRERGRQRERKTERTNNFFGRRRKKREDSIDLPKVKAEKIAKGQHGLI